MLHRNNFQTRDRDEIPAQRILTDAGIGDEHIETRLLRQDFVCSFVDGCEAGMIAVDPAHSRVGRVDAREDLLRSSLFTSSDIYLGRVAACEHLGRRSTKAIGA